MGYTWTRPKDYSDHQRVMKAATRALAAQYGTQFKYGPISEVRTRDFPWVNFFQTTPAAFPQSVPDI